MPIRFSAVVALLGLLLTAPPASARPYVCMLTTQGEFCLEMLPEAAPATVANFLRYVADGDYAHTLIHRSEPGFILQGGGYAHSGGTWRVVPTDPPVVSERRVSNTRGTVAMARFSGQPDSATSEWFVNLADNPRLDTDDGGFAVFARVVHGMDVIDRIAALNVFDLRGFYPAFTRVPAAAPADSRHLDVAQLVFVETAYVSDFLPGISVDSPGVSGGSPYHCSQAAAADTLTEFCGSALTFPVLVEGQLVEATLRLQPDRGELVFALDRSSLRAVADTGQPRAVYAANVLTIPSVQVGERALEPVRLRLSNGGRFEFIVDAYVPR